MTIRNSLFFLVGLAGSPDLAAQRIDRMTARELVLVGDLASQDAAELLRACIDSPSRCRDEQGAWRYPMQLWLHTLSVTGHELATPLLRSMRKAGGADPGFELADARIAASSGDPSRLVALAQENRFRRFPDLLLLSTSTAPEAAARIVTMLDEPAEATVCRAVRAAQPFLAVEGSMRDALSARITVRTESASDAQFQCFMEAMDPRIASDVPEIRAAIAKSLTRRIAQGPDRERVGLIARLATWFPLLDDADLEHALIEEALREHAQDPQDRVGVMSLAAIHRLLPESMVGKATATVPPIICCAPQFADAVRSGSVDSPGWAILLRDATVADLWQVVAGWSSTDWQSPKADLLRRHPDFAACRVCVQRLREVGAAPSVGIDDDALKRAWPPLSRLILLQQGFATASDVERVRVIEDAFDDRLPWRRIIAKRMVLESCREGGLSYDEEVNPLALGEPDDIEVERCLEQQLK